MKKRIDKVLLINSKKNGSYFYLPIFKKIEQQLILYSLYLSGVNTNREISFKGSDIYEFYGLKTSKYVYYQEVRKIISLWNYRNSLPAFWRKNDKAFAAFSIFDKLNFTQLKNEFLIEVGIGDSVFQLLTNFENKNFIKFTTEELKFYKNKYTFPLVWYIKTHLYSSDFVFNIKLEKIVQIFALDQIKKDLPKKISEIKTYHKLGWKEINRSIIKNSIQEYNDYLRTVENWKYLEDPLTYYYYKGVIYFRYDKRIKVFS